MMFGKNSILFYIVVLFSNVIQCITGFAGTVLAMPVSLVLVGYGVAKPVLNVLGIAASVGVILSSPKSVKLREFAKILMFMLPGLMIGELITTYFDIAAETLYKILGVAVIAFTIAGCINGKATSPNALPPLIRERARLKISDIALYSVLVVSGTVHGMFVCGGPLLVLYADRVFYDKQEFRTTLSAVWIVLNGLILISDINSGYFVADTVNVLTISVGVLVFAVVIGNLIARKLNRKAFITLTYILMATSGILLFFK